MIFNWLKKLSSNTPLKLHVIENLTKQSYELKNKLFQISLLELSVQLSTKLKDPFNKLKLITRIRSLLR